MAKHMTEKLKPFSLRFKLPLRYTKAHKLAHSLSFSHPFIRTLNRIAPTKVIAYYISSSATQKHIDKGFFPASPWKWAYYFLGPSNGMVFLWPIVIILLSVHTICVFNDRWIMLEGKNGPPTPPPPHRIASHSVGP